MKGEEIVSDMPFLVQIIKKFFFWYTAKKGFGMKYVF